MSTNPTTNSTPAEGAAAPAKPKMPTTERVIKSKRIHRILTAALTLYVAMAEACMHQSVVAVQNLPDVNFSLFHCFMPFALSTLLQLCWTPVTSLNSP